MPQINPSRAAGYSREWWDMAAAFGSAETEFGVEVSWLDAFIAMQGREKPEDKRRQANQNGSRGGKIRGHCSLIRQA